nr:MAG TPA: hypothetical protein [Caudoviricetes sp.]
MVTRNLQRRIVMQDDATPIRHHLPKPPSPYPLY